MNPGQLTSILQDEPLMPGIDGIPVIAGIPGIDTVAFEGFIPMVAGNAIGGIPVGMVPVVSMLNTGC
jgi:hypothetical protein